MGVPLNHPLMDGFSIVNHPFWGTPMTMETLKGMYMTIAIGVISQLIGGHNCSYKRRTGPRSPRRWLLPSCPQIETLKPLGRFTCLYSMAISGTYIGGTLPSWNSVTAWLGNYNSGFGNHDSETMRSDLETGKSGFGNYDLETMTSVRFGNSEQWIRKLWLGN